MTEAERRAAMDALPHQDWCRWWKEGDCCTCGAVMTEAERLAGVLTDRWPTHQGLLDEAAALLRSQAAEIAALQALCLDYSIACGELSKGLSEDDPMWSQLKSLGERIDAAIDAARQS